MTNLEKKLKDRLEYFEKNDDQFDEIGLWNDIDRDLEKNKFGLILFKRVAMSLIILLLLIFSGQHILNINADESTKTITENSIKDQLDNSQLSSEENTIDYLAKENSIAKSTILETEINERVKQEKTPNNITQSKRAESEYQVAKLFELESKNLKEKNLEESSLIENNHKPIAAELKQAEKEQQFISDQKFAQPFEIMEQSNTFFANVKEIKLLPIKSFFIENVPSENTLSNSGFQQLLIDPNTEFKSSLALVLSAGTNFSFIHFNSSANEAFADLNNNSFSKEVGYNFGLNIFYQFKHKILVGAGLEYQQMWTQFDYSNVNLNSRFIDNALKKIWINSVSGQVINEEYGLVEVVDTLNRTIKHHNNFQRLSIPFQIGYIKRTNKFEVGIVTGLSINYTYIMSGYAISENNQILDFAQNQDFSPINKFGIGFHLSPLISYEVSDNISILVNPKLMIERKRGLILENDSVLLNQLSFNFGIKYDLGK